ncbi:hypothetical protein ACYSNM_08170 [Myroides sp. LJL116]
MNFQHQIQKLWQSYQNNQEIASSIKQGQYTFYTDMVKKDFLILGLQPKGSSAHTPKPIRYNILKNIGQPKATPYQNAMASILKRDYLNLNLLPKTTYMDLFYFSSLKGYLKYYPFINSPIGRQFLNDQLAITRDILEQIIQPKVIVLNSMEVAYFLGINPSSRTERCSLGYEFVTVKQPLVNRKVYKIIGSRKNQGDKSTLVGTYVICYPNLSEKVDQSKEPKLSPIELFYYQQLHSREQQDKDKSTKFPIGLFLKIRGEIQEGNKYAILKNHINVLIQELQSFEKLSTQKMAFSIFKKLTKRNLLSIDELLDLFSITFCKNTFGVENPVLAQKGTNRFKQSDYFTDAFVLFEKQSFYVRKKWEDDNRNGLQKWFITVVFSRYYTELQTF